MVVGECEGAMAWVADVCEGVGVGISLACARIGGMKNNVNDCACQKERGARGCLRSEEVCGLG